MHQIREMLFRGSSNLSPDTESNNNLEEVSKNQEEPECFFDNLCYYTIAWKSITSAGHRKFFLKSAVCKSATEFLFSLIRNRNCTFKSVVRNRKSAATFQNS